MTNCRTKLLSDNPAEDDAFGQHENVAKAIANLVDEEAEGRAVALFGSWGSGKSTVVQILRGLFRNNKKRCVFVFDAWAHQGDPLRRSFLEQQIIAMLAAGWIQGDKWQETREKLARRLKITETKQVPQLTERGVYFLVAALLAPIGLAAISTMNHPDLWITIAALLISLLPLIAIFGTKHLDAKPKAKTVPVDEGTTEYLSMFVKRFETSSRNETIETPEPTSIEFCEIFRKVLRETLEDKERKLIIVIDNLDRVPTSEALAIWATMRTFFEHNGGEAKEMASRLWLLVPFDHSAARRFWSNNGKGDLFDPLGMNHKMERKDSNQEGDLAESFLQKTFQISFHISPPVVSDLVKYFMVQLAEAFPGHKHGPLEQDFQQIYGLYLHLGITKERPVTPREIKLFINKVGALHRQWQDRIPLSHQALYVLCADQIAEDPKILTAWNFPEPKIFELVERKDLNVNLAALHYGVTPDRALEVLLGPKIQSALISGDIEEIREFEQLEGFPALLDQAVLDVCEKWAHQEPRNIASVALGLASLNLPSEHWKETEWRRLRNHAMKVSQWRNLDQKCGQGIVAILKNTKGAELKSVAEEIIKGIGVNLFIDDPKVVKDWSQGTLVVLQELECQNLLSELKNSFRVPGTPSIYLAAIEEVYSNGGERFQEMLKPFCGAGTVIDHFCQLCKDGQLKGEQLAAVQVVTKIAISWPFETLLKAIQTRIATSISHGEFAACLNHMKLLSGTEIGDKVEEGIRWLCRQGVVFDYLSKAQGAADFPTVAELLLTFLKYNSDFVIERHQGQSPQGQAIFNQALATPESYTRTLDECAKLVCGGSDLERLLVMHETQSQTKKLVSAIVRRATSAENHETYLSSKVFLDHIETLSTFVPEDGIATIVRSLSEKGELKPELLRRNFESRLALIYVLLLRDETKDRAALEDWILKDLGALTTDFWTAELTQEGRILELLITLLEDGRKPELTNSFDNALTDCIGRIAAGSMSPSRLREKWRLLPRAMAPHSWRTFYANLFDGLMDYDQAGRERVLSLFEADFFPPNLTASDADQVVRRLFKEILEGRNKAELDWLQKALANRADLIKIVQNDFRQSFLDRLQTALNELPDGLVKARVRGISQLSAIAGDKPPTEVDVSSSFELRAGAATIYGGHIVVEVYGNKLSIGGWMHRDDFAEWTIKAERRGILNVSFEYACDENNGGTFIFAIGNQVLRGKVVSTGTWETFTQMAVGEIQLSPGKHSVTVKCDGELKGALINLRSINFTPTGV